MLTPGRSLTKTYALTVTADSSSSENQSTDSSSPKKGSLLSRLFRRSGRSKQRQIETFSAQFPPLEWFNSRAVHLHSVGTQTTDHVSVLHSWNVILLLYDRVSIKVIFREKMRIWIFWRNSKASEEIT